MAQVPDQTLTLAILEYTKEGWRIVRANAFNYAEAHDSWRYTVVEELESHICPRSEAIREAKRLVDAEQVIKYDDSTAIEYALGLL